MICDSCGACCIIFDISTLNKAAGTPCPHLDGNRRCAIYEERPPVCRAFKADEVCERIASLPFEEKLREMQKIYYA
jgi:Fe-S-cluster containining protein